MECLFSDTEKAFPDYYALLGISIDVPLTDIKTAYKSLSLRYHPDKLKQNYPDASPDQIQNYSNFYTTIQTAWEVLSGPKRDEYDALWNAQHLKDTMYHYSVDINHIEFDIVDGNEKSPDLVSFPCIRCSTSIVFPLEELEGGGNNDDSVIVPCSGCNTRILIKLLCQNDNE